MCPSDVDIMSCDMQNNNNITHNTYESSPPQLEAGTQAPAAVVAGPVPARAASARELHIRRGLWIELER